jgi:hypothetical protein
MRYLQASAGFSSRHLLAQVFGMEAAKKTAGLPGRL